MTTKPDYIPFSQEIFDTIEDMRAAHSGGNVEPSKLWDFAKNPIYSNAVLSNEYGRYLREIGVEHASGTY